MKDTCPSKIKKTKPPAAATKAKRTNYKQAAMELAQNVLFALRFLDTKHGGGALVFRDGKTLDRWEDVFMDSLDGVGYVIDRKAYYKNKYKNKYEKKGKKR